MEPSAHPTDITDMSSNHAALQQMYELETIQWRGGNLFWDGPHDNFCFACGGSMELFGCQTCENAYHAHCMSPTIENTEVPTFWFCPHCVDRELHIPPGSPTSYFTPVSVPGILKSQSSYFTPTSLPGDGNAEDGSISSPDKTNTVPQTPLAHPSELRISHRQRPSPEHQDCGRSLDKKAAGSQVNTDKSISKREIEDVAPPDTNQKHIKRGRPKRIQTPPRKKSKYSAFSAEVDKALAIIYSELESAAKNGKSEDHLRNMIQSLEQQLKLQDGQLALTRRELELVRKDLDKERFKSNRFAGDSRGSREEIARLNELVEKKEAELNDWRAKLKSMIG